MPDWVHLAPTNTNTHHEAMNLSNNNKTCCREKWLLQSSAEQSRRENISQYTLRTLRVISEKAGDQCDSPFTKQTLNSQYFNYIIIKNYLQKWNTVLLSYSIFDTFWVALILILMNKMNQNHLVITFLCKWSGKSSELNSRQMTVLHHIDAKIL